MSKYKYIGYHGTLPERAQKILREGFKISDGPDEWLGSGVYFFEQDIRQAEDFCFRARRWKQYRVIGARIVAQTVLDLVMVSHYNEFKKAARVLCKRYRAETNLSRPIPTSKVIDIMYKWRSFDVVRAAFQVPKREPISYITHSPLPVQIQLCVKHCSCIKEIWEVSA